MSTFFKSEAHKKRFLAATQDCIEDGMLDQWYGSALYILTSEKTIWEKATSYVKRDGILFAQMKVNEDFSDSEDVLVQVADSLFGNGQRIDLQDLTSLDDANFKVAVQAIRLRRDGLRVDEI